MICTRRLWSAALEEDAAVSIWDDKNLGPELEEGAPVSLSAALEDEAAVSTCGVKNIERGNGSANLMRLTVATASDCNR